ncbi:hypothetical protein NYY70_21000, partial [Acinetobacter baumannii]|nr:hypothetical protein [Acinetobacter baumannii]
SSHWREVGRPDRMRVWYLLEALTAEPAGVADDQEDRSQWHVSVHDLSGQHVLMQPFTAHAVELSQVA